MVALQRQIAAGQNVIMDGRDIGTVILPDATLKIFLTASPECRARRRHRELLEKGKEISYEQVLADMNARDHADETRSIAPAVAAPDAVPLDNSALSVEESVEFIRAHLSERLGHDVP